MATNQTTQITVLNDLPRFAGRPKPGEAPFKNEVDARTFLRTVEFFLLLTVLRPMNVKFKLFIL